MRPEQAFDIREEAFFPGGQRGIAALVPDQRREGEVALRLLPSLPAKFDPWPVHEADSLESVPLSVSSPASVHAGRFGYVRLGPAEFARYNPAATNPPTVDPCNNANSYRGDGSC